MHLYDCRFDVFIPQATSGQIADILQQRFLERLEQNPSEQEVKSWKNSLGVFAESIATAKMDEVWFVLEYQLPLSSLRIDSMIIGRNVKRESQVVIAEFKQWERCESTIVPEVVRVGNTEMLHPAAQVRNYREYLRDAHSAFADTDVGLSSCVYLHNVKARNMGPFKETAYLPLIADTPLFGAEDADALADYLQERTGMGATKVLVNSVLNGAYKPSKKLLGYVASAIDAHEPWKLLDEQQLVFDKILGAIKEGHDNNTKKVIIVTGGPGTGKSVVALQVIGSMAKKGVGVVHATGSKAFTTNLRGIVGRNQMFRYFNQFTKTEKNSIDLIICDEAHRLRATSANRFNANQSSGRPQVGEIIDTARVSVFLLDAQQNVRGDEVGSTSLIIDYCEQGDIDFEQFNLGIQFRCAGSDSYLRWVDWVLDLKKARSLAWQTEKEYEVKIFDDVSELQRELKGQIDKGYTARMVAGFCWPWSQPEADGTLPKDVKIGHWSRPWNQKPKDMWKPPQNPEPPARHPYLIWANQPKGFEQIGCIYSAQGFEFDYVGVIWGNDLTWSPVRNSWIANLSENEDRGFRNGLHRDNTLAVERLKHIYRVLSTRGMKGTYFYFLDEDTKLKFESMLHD